MLTLALNLDHQIKARPIPADLFEVIVRTSQGLVISPGKRLELDHTRSEAKMDAKDVK